MNAIIVLSLIGLATLFIGVFEWRRLILPFAIVGMLATLGLTLMDYSCPPDWYNNYLDMISFDHSAVMFSSVLLISGIMVLMLGFQEYRKEDNKLADIVGLILFTLVGGIIMTSYTNLSMLFLGIEILSISLYILAGSKKLDLASNEASLKYFLMGSFATGFLLFGIALIYGEYSTFNIVEIHDKLPSAGSLPIMFKLGLMMMLIGLVFKISAAPFHFWAPDVYQGSPTFITSLMATAVKTAGFAALYRLLNMWSDKMADFPEFTLVLWIIAALTITIGNLSALMQKNVKRMLAYSSISNAGYLLIGIVAMNHNSDSAILYYTLVYSIATILSFAVLMRVADERGGEDFISFTGVGRHNPLLGAAMIISMLSLAGIPPLAGFFSKYYIFKTALESQYLWIVLIAVANSCIGIYYYFRVMIAMFAKEPTQEKIYLNPAYKIVLVGGMVLLLYLGLFPDQITQWMPDNVAEITGMK